MIATRRGLAVLALILGALGFVLAVDLWRRTGPTERTLVPGFDERSVVRLGWTAHPIGPYLTVERAAGAPWRRTAPTPGAVEQAPIASLLATLRGARWHRTRERDRKEEILALLEVDHAHGRLELWIGRPIEGSEQAWISIDDRSYLVDAWVTRSLVPSVLDLAITAPLATIASAPEYTVDGARLVHDLGTGNARLADPPLVLDPAFVATLERTLAELVIDTLPAQAAVHGEAITIRMAGTTVALGGPCEQRVYLAASTGDGCVPRAAADAVRAAVAPLRGRYADIAARMLVPAGVRRVVLADGSALDLARRPLIEGRDADQDRVAQLMLALRSPVDASDVVAAPTTPPIATLTVAHAQGELAIELHAGGVVRRRGEPVALRVPPAAAAILALGKDAYADRTPWREEPTTITAISVDDVTYQRGAVLGEWTRTPAGPTDGASLEAFAQALATPRVVGPAANLARGRRIRVVVRPPMGGETSHTLEVGAATAAGCPAKIGTDTVLLADEICRLVPR